MSCAAKLALLLRCTAALLHVVLLLLHSSDDSDINAVHTCLNGALKLYLYTPMAITSMATPNLQHNSTQECQINLSAEIAKLVSPAVCPAIARPLYKQVANAGQAAQRYGTSSNLVHATCYSECRHMMQEACQVTVTLTLLHRTGGCSSSSLCAGCVVSMVRRFPFILKFTHHYTCCM